LELAFENTAKLIQTSDRHILILDNTCQHDLPQALSKSRMRGAIRLLLLVLFVISSLPYYYQNFIWEKTAILPLIWSA